MRKNNEQTLGEAIRLFIETNGMQERVLESMTIDAWKKQMGKFVENMTEEIYVKKRTLFVKLNSPSFKTELSYGKTKIIAHVNQEIGEDFLEDIRFL